MKADNSIYEAWNDISESQPQKTVEFLPQESNYTGKTLNIFEQTRRQMFSLRPSSILYPNKISNLKFSNIFLWKRLLC